MRRLQLQRACRLTARWPPPMDHYCHLLAKHQTGYDRREVWKGRQFLTFKRNQNIQEKCLPGQKEKSTRLTVSPCSSQPTKRGWPRTAHKITRKISNNQINNNVYRCFRMFKSLLQNPNGSSTDVTLCRGFTKRREATLRSRTPVTHDAMRQDDNRFSLIIFCPNRTLRKKRSLKQSWNHWAALLHCSKVCRFCCVSEHAVDQNLHLCRDLASAPVLKIWLTLFSSQTFLSPPERWQWCSLFSQSQLSAGNWCDVLT